MPNVYKDIKIKYITPEDIEEMKKRLIGREKLTKEEANCFSVMDMLKVEIH